MSMNTITFHPSICTNCRLCFDECIQQAILFEGNEVRIAENCNSCFMCVSVCDSNALTVNIQEKNTDELSGYSGIAVFVEIDNDSLSVVTLELLSKSRQLAHELGCKVMCIILGNSVQKFHDTLLKYGANVIISVEHSLLKNASNILYAHCLKQIIRIYKPEIFLLGATYLGRAVAPRIASSLNTGLTADCTELTIDYETRQLIQTRPTYGGTYLASILCETRRPQMATVRPGVFKASSVKQSIPGKIVCPDINLTMEVNDIEIIKKEKNVEEKPLNSNKNIVIAVGRGIGSKENLNKVFEVAKLLNAEVCATRPVVDAGWLDYSYQVGQTGKYVSPKIYIAIGISGAMQHIIGMQNAKTIVAINQDENANIFNYAHVSIVGNLFDIIQNLINELKASVPTNHSTTIKEPLTI